MFCTLLMLSLLLSGCEDESCDLLEPADLRGVVDEIRPVLKGWAIP